MLSSALMAVLIASSPAHAAEPALQVAQIRAACNAQELDRKFVYYMEKAPSEKDAPGMRLIADTPTITTPFEMDGSRCMTYLTRVDLAR